MALHSNLGLSHQPGRCQVTLQQEPVAAQRKHTAPTVALGVTNMFINMMTVIDMMTVR